MNSNIKDYIELVRSGKVAVCKEQIQLCNYVEKCFKTEDIYVDEQQLNKYLAQQKHFPFKLFEWEKFCFTLHNCVYTSKGRLRWPDLLILVGRGAGKNGYLAFEDFCLLTKINGIEKYHIDICANSEAQARTSFDDVYDVLEDNTKKLSKFFYWNKTEITNLTTKSILRFRTANHKTKDGGRPGKVDFDEYHQYNNYKTIEVFKTGLGKKKRPRTTIITTNGDVRDGPLDSKISTAHDILKGVIPDNGLLPFICKLDDVKEVDNPNMWVKANPSLKYLEELQIEMQKEYVDYKEDPISNSSFMTKRMNIPQGEKDVEVTSWDNILATNQDIPDFTGCDCIAGIDYAGTDDFIGLGLLFKKDGKYYWLSHSLICSNSKDLPRIKAPLREWEKIGLLTFVDCQAIDPGMVVSWYEEQSKKYNIKGIATDGFRYGLIRRAFKDAGYDVDKGGKCTIKMVRPSDQMIVGPLVQHLFNTHNIIWGDNPLMRWYTNNSCRIKDKKGNITYGKIEEKSRKTDGFMALVHALTRADDLDEEQNDAIFFGIVG